MNACHDWLAADYLVRRGFTLTTLPDGSRYTIAGRLRVDLPPPCTCPDCPPLPATKIEEFAA